MRYPITCMNLHTGKRVQFARDSGFRIRALSRGVGIRFKNYGVGVKDLGFRFKNYGFGVKDLGFRFKNYGFGVKGLGLRVKTYGFGV